MNTAVEKRREIAKIQLPSTIRIIYLARGLRGFGDGFATIVLPVYLTRIGYDLVQIGFVLTAALLGTALFTLAIGAIAPRYDLRTLMIFGAALMTLTGLAFLDAHGTGIPGFSGLRTTCACGLYRYRKPLDR